MELTFLGAPSLRSMCRITFPSLFVTHPFRALISRFSSYLAQNVMFHDPVSRPLGWRSCCSSNFCAIARWSDQRSRIMQPLSPCEIGLAKNAKLKHKTWDEAFRTRSSCLVLPSSRFRRSSWPACITLVNDKREDKLHAGTAGGPYVIVRGRSMHAVRRSWHHISDMIKLLEELNTFGSCLDNDFSHLI